MVAGYVTLGLFILIHVVWPIVRAFEREEYTPPPVRYSGTRW